MIELNKILILFLCLSFLFMQLPVSAVAGYYAKVKTGSGITAKPPEALTSPEEDIPLVEEDKDAKKGSKKWLYIGAAAVAAILIGALLIDDDNGGEPPPPGSGTVEVTW